MDLALGLGVGQIAVQLEANALGRERHLHRGSDIVNGQGGGVGFVDDDGAVSNLQIERGLALAWLSGPARDDNFFQIRFAFLVETNVEVKSVEVDLAQSRALAKKR